MPITGKIILILPTNLSYRAELDISFVLKGQGNRHKAQSVKLFFSND